MCPKGDDPLTLNQHNKSFQIIVTSTSNSQSGVLGIRFGDETASLNLDNPTNSQCKYSFESTGKFKDITCTVTSIASTMRIFNITINTWPIVPKENNFHMHDGNPSLDSFFCDISRTSADVACKLVDIKSTNIKGLRSFATFDLPILFIS